MLERRNKKIFSKIELFADSVLLEERREREREVSDSLIFPQTILLTNSLVRKNATFQSVSGWRAEN